MIWRIEKGDALVWTMFVKIFMRLTYSLSLLYDSLILVWKMGVFASVRHTSVRCLDMLLVARILSRPCSKLGIFPCMYKYIGLTFTCLEAGYFLEKYSTRFILSGAQNVLNWFLNLIY